MNNKEVKKIHISKWIYLSISLLINVFIIVQASLPASDSARWSNVFVRFFMNLFNGTGKDTTEIIDVNDIDLTYDKQYQYNYIAGYSDHELVVGKNKRLMSKVLPDNATNTAVKFTSSDESVASIYQNENYAYIKGNKKGTVDITVTSLANNTFIDTYSFNVIDKRAPSSYEVNNISIYQDSLFYLPLSIDNESYYDIDKLPIINSDPTIVDKSSIYPSLYYASNIGEAHFFINDKEFIVEVKNRSDIVLPIFNSIEGNDIVYSNSKVSYKPIIINSPSSKEVLWEVNGSPDVDIDKEGNLSIGDIKEETSIVVRARSLLDTSIYSEKVITIKPITITSFELVIPYYGNHITNMPYMGETGEEIKVWMEDNTGTIGVSGVNVSSSNTEVAEVYAQGSYIYINCIKEGDTRINVTSINNPSVTKYIDLQVVIRGVINHDNYLSFSEFVRKSIGHFLLFLVNGVFTFLFFYELDKDINYKFKKKWHYIAISIILGLFFAGLSEFIQYLVPTRFGSFIDIGVDFGGYLLGVLIILLIIYLIKRRNNNKLKNTNNII